MPDVNQNWSTPGNWRKWDAVQADYIAQNTFIPGGGDDVVFDGTYNGGSGNQNCVMNLARAIESMTVASGYSKTITLQNTLDIQGVATNSMISLLASANAATLRGSPTTATINMLGTSAFGWQAGNLVDLSINVTRADGKVALANVVDDGSNKGHTMIGTVFYVDGQLNWSAGNVVVGQTGANSGINIRSTGEFNIGSANDGWAGGVWGVGVGGQTSYFHIQNDGKVTLKTSGTATLRGDYTTTGRTWVEVGVLDLGGKAEQTTGTFELHDDGTVKVSGPNTVLNNYNGGIEGNGTIDGNLVLGYDPALGPPPFTTPSISPGNADVNNSIGTLTITQSYQVFSNDANTIMNVEADWAYDKIIVQGPYAAINGYLTIWKDPLYHPSEGVSLPLIASNSLLGDFIAYPAIYGNDPWWNYGPPLAGAAKKDGNFYVFYVQRLGS